MKKYSYTPEVITDLDPCEVFVYGANTRGRHGAGAAKLAVEKWGAKEGHYGFNGQSYGIPTKDDDIEVLPLKDICFYIQDFLSFAKENPSKIFLVTKIGTGLSRYSMTEIGSLFGLYLIPSNVILPREFAQFVEDY